MKEQLIKRSDLKSKTAEELMVIYQKNSPEEAYGAFSELYLRFSQNVFSYLIKKVKNQADAEDLLQKIFIKVHESKHLYKDKFKFEQWLFVIAKTSVLDHFRASTRYQNRIQQTDDKSTSAIEAPESAALESLDENQRELLEMKFIDDLSYLEISSVLNKSEMSLRKMVSRLTMNLRKGNV